MVFKGKQKMTNKGRHSRSCIVFSVRLMSWRIVSFILSKILYSFHFYFFLFLSLSVFLISCIMSSHAFILFFFFFYIGVTYFGVLNHHFLLNMKMDYFFPFDTFESVADNNW